MGLHVISMTLQDIEDIGIFFAITCGCPSKFKGVMVYLVVGSYG